MELPPDFPDCTIFLLAKAYQRAHANFQSRLKPYGLTNLQHLVLEAVWYREGQTAAELRKLLILDKATLSGVLERMDEADWIYRVQSTADKRVIRIYPTDRAERLKQRLIRLRQEANRELLTPLSTREQSLLKQMLRDLV